MACALRQRFTRNGLTKKSKRRDVRYKTTNGKRRRVAGYTDKAATQQLAARLERPSKLAGQASHESEGLIDKYAVPVGLRRIISRLRALGLEPKTYGLKGRCSTD